MIRTCKQSRFATPCSLLEICRCLPYKTYGVRKRNLGLASINRQIQKYVANHNKDGPKTKVKMKTFLTALSSVLYSLWSIFHHMFCTANICIFPKVNRGWQIYFGTEESAVKHVDYPGTVCLHFYFCFGTSHIIVICHINIHIDVSVYGNNSQISPPDAMCFVLYCTEYFP